MGDIIDMETRTGVKILCELGDSAECGLAVHCKAEETNIPTKLRMQQKPPQPRVLAIDNPSVVKFCAGQPALCPSRQGFLAMERTQQQEAARVRRVHEIEKDADEEILEEFSTKMKVGE